MKKYINTKISTMLYCVLFVLGTPVASHAHFGSKGPFGGSITCTVVAGDTVYMGTEEGGVFESTSALLVGWRARPVGLKSGKITAIAHTGVNLFAATADSGIFVLNGYVGSDRYWNKVNTGLTNLHVTSLIAISKTTLLAGTTNGLFLTTNSGASWQAVNGDLHHLDITRIVKAGARIFVTAQDGGVYATDNTGASWIEFNDVHTEHIAGTTALSYNAATDALMVLNENGLFIAQTVSTTNTPVYTAAAGFPSNETVAYISNNGANWYIATNKGVYTSSASVINWTSISTGLAGLPVKTVEPFKNGLVSGTRLYGIYKTNLPVVSWSGMNINFNNLKTTAMVTSGTGFIVAATELGVRVSRDIAASYVSANLGLEDSTHVNDLVIAKHFLVAATTYSGVFITADSGKHWTAINTGLENPNIKKVFYSNDILYIIDAAGNVFRASVGLPQWTPIQSGLPSDVKPTSMAFYGNNILLSTQGSGVFIKTETGTSWTAYNTGLSNLNVTSVTALGTKIYAGTDGSGVFVSDSAKAQISWSATAPTIISHTTLLNLNGMQIQALASYAGHIWASCKGGLLVSPDNGATWNEGGNQFNLPSFTDVTKINFVKTRVFVSTENNGLYSNALSEITTITSLFSSTPVNYTALLIAPNPASGAFKLDTKNVSGSVKEIIIYDYNGHVKDRFVQEQDVYSIHYTPGMYLVQVTTSEGTLYTQKMVVK
ncbi:T9SS type A sorting domain-containing protein [Cytophaga hutchinsonii]|nr:T9SS type A sorting domain-containing protein [Cytophaga hutchinsonii]SFX06159.1 Por secretion system C-terminal sorting domain-containing protein [Cytophaga hutchinsonii ATCC 33406]